MKPSFVAMIRVSLTRQATFENAAYMIPGATFGKIISGANKAAKAAKLDSVSLPLLPLRKFSLDALAATMTRMQTAGTFRGATCLWAATSGCKSWHCQGYGRLYNTRSVLRRRRSWKIRNFVDNIGKSSYQQGKDARSRRLPRMQNSASARSTLARNPERRCRRCPLHRRGS